MPAHLGQEKGSKNDKQQIIVPPPRAIPLNKPLFLITAITIISLIFTFAACDDGGGETTHTHTPGAAANCTTPQTCTSCGAVLADIDPNTHTPGPTATCTTPQTCTSCDAELAAQKAHTTNSETWLCTVCNAIAYNLGDTGPGGGKIFYRLEAGFTQYANATDTTGTTAHYLEAAPADMSGTYMWASTSYQSTNISGTGEAIGTGRKNTALILATDVNAPAAKACKDYSSNGKTDWFLPSYDELNQLNLNTASVGNMGTGTYWSSSQHPTVAGNALCRRFSEGSAYFAKNSTYSVRAVRAF
jgi:hypothetical protein